MLTSVLSTDGIQEGIVVGITGVQIGIKIDLLLVSACFWFFRFKTDVVNQSNLLQLQCVFVRFFVVAILDKI